MNGDEMTRRLIALATDYDVEADRLFTKARRGGIGHDTIRAEGTTARQEGEFLRSLASAIDDLPDAAVKALERRLR